MGETFMRLAQRIFELVSAAEMNLIGLVFAVLAVALMAGSYWYMRAKMRPTGQDEPEAARPASAPNGVPGRPAPRGGGGTRPPGTATRGWIYKTDGSGRPRRFLNHREAAWWAARKVSAFFVLLPVYPLLWAIFSPDASGQRLTVLPIMGAIVFVWLLTAAGVYLYVALSGGVMDRARRQDHR